MEEQKRYSIFKADGKFEKKIAKELTLKEMQEIVGGDIELIPFYEHYLVINENGKALNLGINPGITGLARALDLIAPNDYIVGDVIVAEQTLIK